MADSVEIALAAVAQAFAAYPRRAVLDRCPHCGPPVRVEDADLYWLAIKLGNTVGDRADVKSLVPLLLARLVTSDELDPEIVLGKLTQEHWRSWPRAEQSAIEEFLESVWAAVLAEFPAGVGAFTSAAEFLRGIGVIGFDPAPYLVAWESTSGIAADRHLAEIVRDVMYRPDRMDRVTAWLRREEVRDRLFRAFERDHAAEWAGEFARAYDLAAMLVS
ncbi:hypothetical protein ACFVUS_11195 [Nocardia sp. NPDC058058]|uniref:hypothetical protein n=1 Tax=Nocardia sp. NPDC058058 TaxID=3346317 RepID=UPI0036D775F4